MLAEVRSVPQVAPPSGTSPTRRRSSATTASPSATGRTSATGFDSTAPGAAKLTAFRLQSGRWATGPGEVVIDAATSEKQHYAVGDRVRIDTRDEAGTFRVVGVTRFGNVKSLGTVTTAVFDLETAQKLFHKQGRYDSILVAGKAGTSGADVRKALAAKLGDSAKVQTAARP